MDRNLALLTMYSTTTTTSLSARRAWIEILYQLYDTYAKVSLSARRAWIEIARKIRYVAPDVSSLSARRAWIEIRMALFLALLTMCRSPQGERG